MNNSSIVFNTFSSWKNSNTHLATISPTSWTEINSSNVAFFNPSIDLNLFTKSLAVLTPTFGIPSEYINLYNSGVLLLSIAPRRF